MTDIRKLCESGGKYLEAGPDYETSRLVIYGAPMDYTVSFRPGSRGGPQAIRQASVGLEEYSMYCDKDLRDARYYDAGDLLLPPGNAAKSLEVIEAATEALLDDGKFPLLLGGEHLITLGALRAFAGKYTELAVIHLDAHADLRKEYLGEPHSHASVMYHVYHELGVDLYQFGIRSAAGEEIAFAGKHTHFHPFHVLEPLQNVFKRLENRHIYVTIDIDVLDPAYAPGTGTPEPGGITSAEFLAAVGILGRLNVVGMDLVEVAPVYDTAGITAILAAKAVREVILSFA